MYCDDSVQVHVFMLGVSKTSPSSTAWIPVMYPDPTAAAMAMWRHCLINVDQLGYFVKSYLNPKNPYIVYWPIYIWLTFMVNFKYTIHGFLWVRKVEWFRNLNPGGAFKQLRKLSNKTHWGSFQTKPMDFKKRTIIVLKQAVAFP